MENKALNWDFFLEKAWKVVKYEIKWSHFDSLLLNSGSEQSLKSSLAPSLLWVPHFVGDFL